MKISKIQQQWIEERVRGQTLHVGCGRKPVRKEAVINIDANPDKVEWSDIILDVHDLSIFPDGSFDTVISNHVLQSLLYPIKALREMARVLCVGGKMAHVVPDARYVPKSRWNRPHHPFDHTYHLWYGPQDFEQKVMAQLTDVLEVTTLEDFTEVQWSFKLEAIRL